MTSASHEARVVAGEQRAQNYVKLFTPIEREHNLGGSMPRQPRTVRQRVTEAILLVVLLPLWLPLIVIGVALFALHRLVLYLLVWLLWVPKGKDTLFVYSNSPIWQEYMTQQVLRWWRIELSF